MDLNLNFLSQKRVILENFNKTAASNPNAEADSNPIPSGLPTSALKATTKAMREGMVLVVSLWGGYDKLGTWLNGECQLPYERCGIPPNIGATMVISNLQLSPASTWQ